MSVQNCIVLNIKVYENYSLRKSFFSGFFFISLAFIRSDFELLSSCFGIIAY